MSSASRNAFKGYTYQQYIYSLMVSKMDAERYINNIDAEVDVDNNFDDIYIQTDNTKYRIQVKNYPDLTLKHIKINNDIVYIKGKKIKLSNDFNIIIVNTDNFKGNTNILGLKSVKLMKKTYLVPLTTSDIEELIENTYMKNSRLHTILNFSYERCVNCNFSISKKDLPKIIKFKTDLEENTILIRPVLKKIPIGINLIIGKPGVGKSHYVNEIKESINNIILYRFWISSQDPNLKKRLQFKEFMCDISYNVFNSPQKKKYEEIVNEINTKKLTIVIDGLDHVENYNFQELELYIKFIEDIKKAKVLVLSRPLQYKLPWKKQHLENWNINETIEYLHKAHNIFDYSTSHKIYNITKGYPILTFFIAKDYNLTGKINVDHEIPNINEYYSTLINNVDIKEAFSIFSLNTSFYQKEEIIDLLNCEMLSNILFQFIEKYPYLFKINLNRISLIHDSFNTYLRKNIKFSSDSQINILKKIKSTILNKEIRYLSRFGNFEFDKKFILEVINEYCDLEQYKYLTKNTIDYESIQEFYKTIKSYIDYIDYKLDIYKYYSLVMIILIIERNDLIGEHNILFQVYKYMSLNDMDESYIFSNGVMWCTYLYFKTKDTIPYERLLNELNYSYTIDDLEETIIEDEEFSYYLEHNLDEDVIWNKIINKNLGEYDKKLLLIEYFVLSFINKGKYYNLIKNFIYYKDNSKILLKIKQICNLIGIREFFANHILFKVRYRLYELGVVNYDNPFLNKTLKEFIKESAPHGSFYVNEGIISYMRLAYYQSRNFDISDLNIYYGMYYNRKDYSVINLNKALIILEKRTNLDEMLSVSILQNVMQQSQKGIRHILDEYIDMKDNNFTMKLINSGIFDTDFPVDIFALEKEKINLFKPEDIRKKMYSILDRNIYGKNIYYHDIRNALESRYKKIILDMLDFYDYSLIDVPKEKTELLDNIEYTIALEENEKEYSLFENGYVRENDYLKINTNLITPIELSRYTNGWHACLPYINLYKQYDKEYLKTICIDIIHTSLFAKVQGFEFAGNWRLCLGNILEFIDMIDLDVDWEKLKKILFLFLDISLINTESNL